MSVLDDPAISLARLSVAQYHQMIASGVLIDGDPLELFEGVLVDKMTEGPAHSYRITQLARLIMRSLGDSPWQLRVQHPISTDDSEPEPDLAIVVDRDYSTRHPSPAEVACIIEVAGTSLSRDRSTKQRIYATAGIVRFIIVNLNEGVVEIYTQPTAHGDARYLHHDTLSTGVVDLGPLALDAERLLA